MADTPNSYSFMPTSLDAVGMTVYPFLTERQLQVLQTVFTLIVQKKVYPTQREVADVLGFTQATVGQHLEALVKKTYLVREPGVVKRNIRLTPLAITRLKEEGQMELL